MASRAVLVLVPLLTACALSHRNGVDASAAKLGWRCSTNFTFTYSSARSRPASPFAVRLVATDQPRYRPMDTLIFEASVTNVSGAPVLFPVSTGSEVLCRQRDLMVAEFELFVEGE